MGGSSDTYQLHGPYVLDKSFENIRVVFDVAVVGTSYDTDANGIQQLSVALEDDLRKRDQNLTINLDGTSWSYVHGTDILNTTASLAKSGNPLLDRGFSRGYTCTIEGELPADDSNTGLRDVSWHVAKDPGQPKTVTMQGVYTALSGTAASVNYLHANGADAEATTFLLALDSSVSWQLLEENFTPDRNDHACNFTRTYVELLVSQTTTALPNDGAVLAHDIVDHRVVFTDLSQHPGDSYDSVYRFRIVVGSYDCAIDIERTTDLDDVFTNQVKPQILALFQSTFTPVIFCIEDMRKSYDESSKRMSVAIQFKYQKQGGDNIVEVAESTAFRESRTIDYTPTHGKDELGMYADPGWIVLEFIMSRTAVILGEAKPQKRVSVSAVHSEGWNLIQNTSQVTPQFIGDPDEEQIEVSVLTETMVYRFNRKPAFHTAPPIGEPQPVPITPTGAISLPGPKTHSRRVQ